MIEKPKLKFHVLTALVFAAVSILGAPAFAQNAASIQPPPAAATATVRPPAPPASGAPNRRELAELIENRYTFLDRCDSYTATFSLWQPDPAAKGKATVRNFDGNYDEKHKKRIEKYRLWVRCGDDALRLLSFKGENKGTELYYDPASGKKVTVVRGKRIVSLPPTDKRVADLFNADIRLLKEQIIGFLNNPGFKVKIPKETKGRHFVITSPSVPISPEPYNKNNTITSRWTVELNRDYSLNRILLEQKYQAPPGMLDQLGMMFGRKPAKAKFKLMSVMIVGRIETDPPIPADHFIWKKGKKAGAHSGGKAK